MSGLEQRYRRLLRLLPASYRARWEEEMVDTFLLTALPADTDAERARSAAERAPDQAWRRAGAC